MPESSQNQVDIGQTRMRCAGVMVTVKNLLGIVGLTLIALFWVFITGSIYGGVFVGVLVIVVVVVLTFAQRRKRTEPPAKS